MNPSTKTSLDPGDQNVIVEDDRTGLTAETIKRAIAENLFYSQGKFPAIATKNDFYMALAYTVRDRQLHRWINTIETYLRTLAREIFERHKRRCAAPVRRGEQPAPFKPDKSKNRG